MTRAHLRAHWSGIPSLSQPLLATLLRACAMLVLCAASIFRMILSLLSRECHADVELDALPEQETASSWRANRLQQAGGLLRNLT